MYDREEFVKSYFQAFKNGVTKGALAKQWNLTKQHFYIRVRTLREKFGYDLPELKQDRSGFVPKLSWSDRYELVKMYAAAHTFTEIASLVNLSPNHLSAWMSKFNSLGYPPITMVKKMRINRDDFAEKWNSAMVMGMTMSAFAKEQGVPLTTMSKRVSRMRAEGVVLHRRAEVRTRC